MEGIKWDMFQQLMDVMKEERKKISEGVSVRLNRKKWGDGETGNSSIRGGDIGCKTGGELEKRSSKKFGDKSETEE